jgi:UDP-N-acetylmuramate: L-alanyl-gamma-D-glutamyl-meso-diaminopimelate ligase
VVSEVARIEQLKPEERLNPGRLMQDLRLAGKPSAYLPNVDSILEHIAQDARKGDVVCVFSNGGFDGIHGKLLRRFTDHPASA